MFAWLAIPASGSPHHRQSYQEAFQKPQGLICPGATRANTLRPCSRNPDCAGQVDLGQCPWEVVCKLPDVMCHVSKTPALKAEVQQVPSVPEPPCSQQQPLQAPEQGPANSLPYSDAEPAPLLDFGAESAAAGADSVLPSKVFLPASTPQAPVCVPYSRKALWFNWPAVAPTAQDGPNPGDYAYHDIAGRKEGNSSCHLSLTSLGLKGPCWHI